MATVHVIDVMDGNTLAISPPWHLGTAEGYLVRIRGMHTDPLSEPKGQVARYKLTLLLLGTWVQIRQTGELDGRAQVCDVFYQGRPIQMHFPEYDEERFAYVTAVHASSLPAEAVSSELTD